MDEWDTHSANPYVSEYIEPFSGRDPDWAYNGMDVCHETFALILWKLQEDYHMDYKTAFLAAGEWRRLSNGRLHLMFGDDGHELDLLRSSLLDTHPEVLEMEKALPHRNILGPRPSDNLDFMEGSGYE